MLNDHIHAALIQTREHELRARVDRPHAERPARPRRSPHLPQVIVTLRTLRIDA
jgi:hypothetical protein